MTRLKLIGHETLSEPCDVVEYCPTSGHQDICAIGTYQINRNAIDDCLTRSGACHIFESKAEGTHFKSSTALGAVFDIQWCPSSEIPTLAVADADGSLSVFHMLQDTLIPMAHCLTATSSEILICALDWAPKSQEDIVTVDSEGSFQLSHVSAAELNVLRRQKAHDHEVWSVAWDQHAAGQFYTGSDDCKLKAWDSRQAKECWVSEKTHSAGVTHIVSHPDEANLILTGSYDDHLRLFDTRQMSKAVNAIHLQGGVWRAKLNPFRTRTSTDILCASMHAGFHIVNLANLSTMKVMHEFGAGGDIHLAYGCDWKHSLEPHGEQYLTVCEFYSQSNMDAAIEDRLRHLEWSIAGTELDGLVDKDWGSLRERMANSAQQITLHQSHHETSSLSLYDSVDDDLTTDAKIALILDREQTFQDAYQALERIRSMLDKPLGLDNVQVEPLPASEQALVTLRDNLQNIKAEIIELLDHYRSFIYTTSQQLISLMDAMQSSSRPL